MKSPAKTVLNLLQSYDDFLGMIDDRSTRDHLEEVLEREKDQDETFQEARRLGQRFQDGLQQLFFENHDRLSQMTREYGVF